MAFDLASSKPVAATAAPSTPAAPAARGGFDLASAAPVEDVNEIPGQRENYGKPGYTARGNLIKRPAAPEDDRPVNGVDVLLGSKGRPGAAFDKVLGVVETPITAVSGMLGGLAGAANGLGRAIVKKVTTGQGTSDKEMDDNVRNVADAVTYRPRSATGATLVEGLGHALEPLAALPTSALSDLGRAVSSARVGVRGLALPAAAAQDAADVATVANGQQGTLRQLATGPKQLSGVGAADVAQTTQRTARAQALPVPAKLTKGQRTGDFDQIAFEQETAKLPEGKALKNMAVEQNNNLLQNFDAFRDATGANAYGLRPAGRVVDKALVNKYEAAKTEVRGAYTAAREAGEMAEPVPYNTLSDYLAKHSAEIDTNNVPMLAAVKRKLEILDPEGTGKIPLNEMEELRKMAGRLTQDGTPNAAHVGPVKGLIDSATENAGGDLYREARRLNTNMAKQFENVAVIDKLLRTKPGGQERIVALEDVADHAIMGGSTDDVRHVRRVLTAGAGDEGVQAWKELQGATLDKLRDTMFPAGRANNAADQTVAQFSRFDKLVKGLDDEGKLEVVFGKQGASQLRDFTEHARTVLTSPEGANNRANTASALARMFDKTMNVTGSVPGLSHASEFVQKKVKSAALKRRATKATEQDE